MNLAAPHASDQIFRKRVVLPVRDYPLHSLQLPPYIIERLFVSVLDLEVR